ncbi:MAG: hypothetical protein QOH96_3541 [Blastocatellia bacterium]|nr:hypothetical protein [Blastocatellia bacterium]
MTSFHISLLAVLTVSSPAGIFSVLSQNQQTPIVAASTATRSTVPSPAELYEEAATYEQKKFKKFEHDKVPFDPKLRDEVVAQRKALAKKNAGLLASRGVSTPADTFYLGLLYGLGDDAQNIIKTMQRYLTLDTAVESDKAQSARYTIAKFAAALDKLELAEDINAEFLKHQPQKPLEHLALERVMFAAYSRLKQNERAALHGEEALKLAIAPSPGGKPLFGPQDIYAVGVALASTYADLNQPAKTVATLRQLQNAAINMPSLPFFNDATIRLIDALVDAGRKPEALKTLDDAIQQEGIMAKGDTQTLNAVLALLRRKQSQLRVQGEQAPELIVTKWIGQNQLKISDLRGQVVLLDFWATWCGPCIAAIPEIRQLNEKFKSRGVVFLGVTKYYGYAKGRPLTPPQELAFLENFKKENNLPYPFAISDNDDNAVNYAVAAIPTTVIIDRKGVVRFIGTGYGPGSEKRLNDLLEKITTEQ